MYDTSKRVSMPLLDNRGRTPKKDTHEEFEDTKGVIRGRTPKKYRQ